MACSHRNVQQWTDVCLDCGRNINQSDEDYANELRQKVRAKNIQSEIASLEAQLKGPCPHNRVQEFTECCLDCGKNIYD